MERNDKSDRRMFTARFAGGFIFGIVACVYSAGGSTDNGARFIVDTLAVGFLCGVLARVTGEFFWKYLLDFLFWW